MIQTCPSCRSEIVVPEGTLKETVSCRICGSAVRLRVSEPTRFIRGPAKVPDQLGPYKIIRLIGHGAMGEVYEAVHAKLDRRVALKVLPPDSDDRDYMKRFQREAEAAARLQHPGIVYVYDFGEDNGFTYLAMQFVEGENLKELMQKKRLTPREAAIAVQQAGNAIHHAHTQGIIHRDLKPANLMRSKEKRVLVADFGLARDSSRTQMTVAGTMLGSPAYMSPEQAMGELVDARSDVYSLGATLYELLTSVPPFRGDSMESVVAQLLKKTPEPPSILNPAVPPELDEICLKCLEKDPKRRFASALDLVNDLKKYLRSQGVPVSGARWPVQKRRRTVVWIVAAVAAAVALACVIYLLVRRTRPAEGASSGSGPTTDREVERADGTRRPLPEGRTDLDEIRKQADAAFESGDWTAAIRKYQTILSRVSTDLPAALNLAVSLTQRGQEGDWIEATRLYSKLSQTVAAKLEKARSECRRKPE